MIISRDTTLLDEHLVREGSPAHEGDLTALTVLANTARRGRERSSAGFNFALVAVFFLLLMLCLMVGVNIYRDAAASRVRADAVRVQTGLVVGAIRSTDMADAYLQGEGPEGPALVMVTELPSGTYETRLYLYEGSIVEEYAIAGRDYNPENAVALMQSSVFSFSLDGNLLAITTDEGTSYVTLRSASEGRAAWEGGEAL